MARRFNPILTRGQRVNLLGFYGTIRESEYAADVMFRSPADLKVRHVPPRYAAA